VLRTIVTKASLTTNVATLQVVSNAGLYAGWTVTVEGVSAVYDGTVTLTNVETVTVDDVDLQQVSYALVHADVAEASVYGQLVVPVTWATYADVVADIAYDPIDFTDISYLELALESANSWCWNKRAQAGYTDIPTIAPEPQVKRAVIKTAGSWYKGRGAVDNFPSFQELDVQPQAFGGQYPDILRMLGVGKPKVA